jgi:hypothetical protein
LNPNPDTDPAFEVNPIRIRGFDSKNWKNSAYWKKIIFYQKLQFTYPKAFLKDVQATEEAFEIY